MQSSKLEITQISFNCLKIYLVKILPPCLALEQIAGLRRLGKKKVREGCFRKESISMLSRLTEFGVLLF